MIWHIVGHQYTQAN